MDVSKLRALRSAHPFKPFYVVLIDGRRLPVERPAYLAISKSGEQLVHARSEGGFDFIRASEVQDIVVDEQMSTIWRRRSG